MMIKKFTAPTMKEAVNRMKKELGPDAVILKTNKVSQGGLLDFVGKEGVEIMAAVDKGSKPLNTSAPAAKPEYRAPAPPAANFSRPAAERPERDNMQTMMLQTELNEMRSSMAKLSSFLKYSSVPSLPGNLQMVMKQLIDNEVDDVIARELVEEIHNELSGSQYEDLKLIVSMLLEKIGERIKIAKEVVDYGNRPKVVMLVGPTGVGKTTTIAKLATNQKLINKKKVALISADTFRIGAVDQLKTFANIAEIPLTVVYTPKDMQTAINNYRDMDVIYIDTTGRSQRDVQRLKEMKKFVIGANPDEIHLCLSITTRFRDTRETLDKFSLFKYNRLLFTKIDETSSLGIILNILNEKSVPVSYLTNGQNVPEDIGRATVSKLAKMIVRRKSN
ncbi:MAG: flagellar biosynthesis protein FlhF [bacterium]|nr:flagellar biosynthesis protein FlhF [bacterium]